MYTEQDLTSIREQLKRRRTVTIVVSALLLIAMIVTFILRIEAATVAVTCALGIFLVFWLDLFVAPVKAYATLLNNFLHGRTHEFHGVYDRLEEPVSLVDGVKFRTLITLEESGDDHDPHERMFYLDVLRSIPENIVQGTPVTIVYHDHAVASIKADA